MKKIILILICAFILPQAVFAEAFTSAELTLQLGSYIAIINGESVPVEAPFLSESGITLAPIEAVSQAFDNFDKSDYKIINNSSKLEFFEDSAVAVVNGEEETMPASTVTVNGSLMVPIRFVCDKLNALIEYDDATCKINIKKSADFSEIFKKSVSGYWCDEDYGWMIKLPNDYDYISNEYDGSQTNFANAEFDKAVTVYVKKTPFQNINQARLYFLAKYNGDILRKEEMIFLSDGTPAFYAEYEDYSLLLSIKGEHFYSVEFDAYDADIFKTSVKEAENALKSFTFSIDKALLPENISKLNEGGYEVYTDKELGFSVNRMESWSKPDEYGSNEKIWYNLSYDLIEKVYSDEIFQSAMQVRVFSKSEGDTTKNLAEAEKVRMTDRYNPEYMSEITETAVKSGDFDGTRIEYIINFDGLKQINKTEFFIVDNYVYEAKYYAVFTETADEERLGITDIEKMFDSIKVKGADEDVLGYIINTDALVSEPYVTRIYNERKTFSAEFPSTWKFYTDAVSIGGSPDNRSMSFEVLSSENISTLAKAKATLYSEKNFISSSVKKTTFIGKQAYRIDGKLMLDNGNVMQLEGYIFVEENTAYLVTASVRDVYASKKNLATLSDVLKSFKLS